MLQTDSYNIFCQDLLERKYEYREQTIDKFVCVNGYCDTFSFFVMVLFFPGL